MNYFFIYGNNKKKAWRIDASKIARRYLQF